MDNDQENKQVASEAAPPPSLKKLSADWYGFATSSAQAKKAKPGAEPAEKLPRLTEDEWNAMDGKARWDSVVALRGPDLVGSQALKWFTSSVIRHRLSGIMRTGGLVNQHLPFVVLPADGLDLRAGRGNFDASHFIQHVYEAANWLKVPIAFVSAETFSTALLKGQESYLRAGMILLKDLSEPHKGILDAYLQQHGARPQEGI